MALVVKKNKDEPKVIEAKGGKDPRLRKIHVDLPDLKTPWRKKQDKWGRPYTCNTLTGQIVYAGWVLDEVRAPAAQSLAHH